CGYTPPYLREIHQQDGAPCVLDKTDSVFHRVTRRASVGRPCRWQGLVQGPISPTRVAARTKTRRCHRASTVARIVPGNHFVRRPRGAGAGASGKGPHEHVPRHLRSPKGSQVPDVLRTAAEGAAAGKILRGAQF